MNLTADIFDEYGDEVSVLSPLFKDYGQKTTFEGRVSTLRVKNDNSLVREMLGQGGDGKVLIVDGGGSDYCALIGGNLAVLGNKNKWAGVVINGCVRDSTELANIDFGIKAIATNPRKSVKAGLGDKEAVVTFAGVEICPGQYVYCDADGIVVASRNLKY